MLLEMLGQKLGQAIEVGAGGTANIGLSTGDWRIQDDVRDGERRVRVN